MSSRAYNFLKRGCGPRTADQSFVNQLTSLSVDTDTPLNDVLDLVRDCEIRWRKVAVKRFGQATSTQN